MRRHYASDTIASFSSEELDNFKLSGGDTNSNLQMKNNARSEPRIKNKLLTHLNANDTFSVPPSPMSRGRNRDQRRSLFHDSEDDADTAYLPTGKDFTNKEADKFNEDKVPKTKNFGIKEKMKTSKLQVQRRERGNRLDLSLMIVIDTRSLLHATAKAKVARKEKMALTNESFRVWSDKAK